MTARNYTNTATPQPLSVAVSDTATTLTVSSTVGFPAPPFILGVERGTSNEEVCLCTGVTATTFAVTRAYDGTTAKAHDVGSMVEHTVSAIDYREAGSPARMTTAERDALSGVNLWEGREIFNIDSHRTEVWDSTNAIWHQHVRLDGDTMTGALGVKSVNETVATPAVGATTTLDARAGTTHTVTLNQNVTLAISNLPAGKASAVTVILKQDATGSRTVTWPTGTKWPDGVAPTLGTAANATNIVTFLTPDGGTTLYGFLAGRNLA